MYHYKLAFLLSLFLAIFFMPLSSKAADCTAADINLTRQEEVTNFQATYGGGGTCDMITGSLNIGNGDVDDPQSDITDLSGLSDISEIGDSLRIDKNPLLTNVDGLNGIVKIGGGLGISRNPQLLKIGGLNGLLSVGYNIVLSSNPSLTTINGLLNLPSAMELSVQFNLKLNVIAGLSSLSSLGTLTISHNDALTRIDGLVALTIVGKLYISYNNALTSIDGLPSLTRVGHTLRINDNASLININGLSALTDVGINFSLSDNISLTDVDGLSALTRVGYYIFVSGNKSLTNVDGLSSLTWVGNVLSLTDNTSLANVDGLSSLTRVGFSLDVTGNTSLTNVDGLYSLISIGYHLLIESNSSLESCDGLSRLLDQWDDGVRGPGPGDGGVPDVGDEVVLGGNLTGCNSIDEIFANTTTSRINVGLNDAWYNPATSGQGFFITVFPDLGTVSLAWFTYDTEFPPADAVANLGDPGHRWLTAVGTIEGNQAIMDIEMTSGGLFDTATEIQRTDPPGSDGTIILTFDSCNSGIVEYDILSINRQGIVPIQRVANDNIVLCEVLNSN